MRPADWALAVQNAESRAAHLDLANHYDEVAQELLEQSEEEKRMLDAYISSPHKYSKRILKLKGHAQREIQDLNHAALESRKLADYHREMADEMER